MSRLGTSEVSKYEHILTSYPAPGVLLITFNRPKASNALCTPLLSELIDVLNIADKDEKVGAVVMTGSAKVFAGASVVDIKEIKDKDFPDMYKNDVFGDWQCVAKFRKPIIAAVSGYALGGGCELALMCGTIFAAPSAIFDQPEINHGIIPAAGGIQRLARAARKARAMELVLTGRTFSAAEAEKWGVVSRVVENVPVVDESVKLAQTIAD